MLPCLGPAEGAAAPTLVGAGGRGGQAISKAPPIHPQKKGRQGHWGQGAQTTQGPFLTSQKKTPKSQTHPGVTSPDPQPEWGTALHRALSAWGLGG